jgi:hypothetical protein
MIKEVKKFLLGFIISFCLIFGFINFFPVKNLTCQDFMGNGCWMHVDTFINKDSSQISNFAKALKRAKFDFVFILAKDIDGLLTYPSKYALRVRYESDYMGEIVRALHKEGIKVYFYFVVNTDPIWLMVHPEDTVYQAGIKGNKSPVPHPEKKLINLTSKAYMDYIASIILEAISKYDIYGIQLDYIRYSNGFYGFSQREIELAKAKKIDIDKIIDLTYRTFVSPGDWKTIFLKYDEGDKDVLEWANLREEIIFNFANYISRVVRNKGKEFGTTLVSSGAFDSKFADGGSSSLPYAKIHFGQSYEKISSISNFVTPMAYHGEHNNVCEWVSSVCKGVKKKVAKNCKVAIGIQANSTTTEKMLKAIDASLDNSYSFVLFRIGTFCLGFYDFLPKDNLNVSIYINVFNFVEGKNVRGITFSGLGGAIDPYKDSKFNWIIEKDYFKFFSSKGYLAQTLSDCKILMTSQVNFNLLNNIFSPYLMCSDEKGDFPTYTVKPFNLLSLFIFPDKGEILVNGLAVPFYNVKILNNNTFINSSLLPAIFNCNVFSYMDSLIVIKSGDKEIKINSTENSKIYYKLGEKTFSIDTNIDNLFKDNNSNYVPLRRVLEFFGFSIFYNSFTKAISCLKIYRDFEAALFSKFSEIGGNLLLLSSSASIYIEWSDLLKEQYLKLAYEMHLKGRKVFVLCNLEKNQISYFDLIFNLININEPQILTLDGLSYYLPDKLKIDFNNISNVEIFLNYVERANVQNFSGRISLIINSLDSLATLIFDTNRKYYLQIDDKTLDYIFLPTKEVNLNLLYLSNNFRF